MAKKIFISFAIEDKWAKERMVGQAKNNNTPFEFLDKSILTPFDSKWKTQCREKIKACDGVVAMISKNTKNADGQLWEIKCAKEEGIPIIGIYCTQDDRPATLPTELSGVSVKSWTWPNISSFIDTL